MGGQSARGMRSLFVLALVGAAIGDEVVTKMTRNGVFLSVTNYAYFSAACDYCVGSDHFCKGGDHSDHKCTAGECGDGSGRHCWSCEMEPEGKIFAACPGSSAALSAKSSSSSSWKSSVNTMQETETKSTDKALVPENESPNQST